MGRSFPRYYGFTGGAGSSHWCRGLCSGDARRGATWIAVTAMLAVMLFATGYAGVVICSRAPKRSAALLHEPTSTRRAAPRSIACIVVAVQLNGACWSRLLGIVVAAAACACLGARAASTLKRRA